MRERGGEREGVYVAHGKFCSRTDLIYFIIAHNSAQSIHMRVYGKYRKNINFDVEIVNLRHKMNNANSQQFVRSIRCVFLKWISMRLH